MRISPRNRPLSMLGAGDRAPSFTLPDIGGATVADPWQRGAVALVFFKVTCPVCQMVAPKVKAFDDAGLRLVAVGQDPVPALDRYARRYDQAVTTVSEPPPFEVSTAYGITAVPSLFLVGADGVVVDAVGAWDRAGWNRVATTMGGPKISREGDGLPSFRPG